MIVEISLDRMFILLRHTLMVDGHIATASNRGDNYHLDLDGILFLG